MKKNNFLTIIMLFLAASASFAQVQKAQTVQVGNTSTNAQDASAALQIDDTARGVLLPRMTTTQRDAIANPAKGLIIFNTTTNAQETNTGTSSAPVWTSAPNSNAIWSTTGNAGTDGGTTNFIGTKDDKDLVFKRNNETFLALQNINATNRILSARLDVNATQNSYTFEVDASNKSIGYANLSVVSNSYASLTMKNKTNTNYWQWVATSDDKLRLVNKDTYSLITADNVNRKVAVRDNFTSTESNSALLEMNSTSKGFLPPRMTNTQYNAIVTPAEGLVVYCTDCAVKGLRVYNGTNWTDMMNNSVPTNTVAPVVSSSPSTFMVGASGVTFSASTGTWSGSPTYTYQWQLDGTAITGATSATYTPATISSGNYSCTVTATNSVGAKAVSTTYAVQTAAPVNTVAPVIAENGGVVSVNSAGTWTGGSTSYSYQWRKGGTNISGATSSSYQVPTADFGASFTCAVSSSNNVGSTTAISNAITVNYLLSNLSSSAAVAYSLRKIGPTATFAVKVRRSSDNSTQDIGFDTYGNLDSTALATFVGSGNGFVDTWYDQSGNARNAAQATVANQPMIVTSGAIVTSLSKPSIIAATTTSQLIASSYTGYSGSDISVNVVTTPFSIASMPNFTSIYSITAGASRISLNVQNQVNTAIYTTPGGNTGVQMPTTGGAILNLIKSGTGVNFYQNGTLVDSSSNSATNSSYSYGPLSLFVRSGQQAWNQPISEFIIINAAISNTDKQVVEKSQGLYYGITVQ